MIKRRLIAKTPSAAVVGPPFTRAFERYLDHGKALTYIRRAMLDMRPRKRQPWSLELRILWAIVENGENDPELLRAKMRCSPAVFYSTALRALQYLDEKSRAVA